MLVWFGMALLGMSFAPPFLRKAVAILPMLIGIALLVGQINEARLFLAFVPVALPLLGYWLHAASADRQPRYHVRGDTGHDGIYRLCDDNAVEDGHAVRCVS
jgi:hypothetical protein